ncbi:MAG: FAD-binding oxidoreductase [Candidatus Dadabacteria bacterium]|nr:FAD-binding oxidoreductase [Candidatus Dadabacteria bacterium]
MSNYSFDILFIGAGIMGSASAYALSKELKEKGQNLSIGVIDLDLEGEHSSTLKNAGGVRATWRNRANIELCKYSIDFYETISEEIQFRKLGYYWMHDKRSWEEINKNYPLYKKYGLPVELHSTDDISRFLPFVDNLEGVSGLSISKKAGLIDHYSLREYYRREARLRGVKFLDRLYVRGIVIKNGQASQVTAYDLRTSDTEHKNLDGIVQSFLVEGEVEHHFKEISFRCGVLINTAGAWGPRVSEMYGFKDTMVKPRRRQMVVMKCPDVDLSSYGMIIDTSDIYFHNESGNILAGYSNMDEPYGYNFEFSFGGMDEKSLFVKHIWVPLWKRISKFEKVKFIRGWAGIYAETPDRSGYLGKVPGLDNIYESIAHTGRGLMISYGAAVALSDLILEGKIREELRGAEDLSRNRPEGDLFEGLHL